MTYARKNTTITQGLYDGVVALISDYTVAEVATIIDALDASGCKVWHQLKLRLVGDFVASLDPNKKAIEVFPLIWMGGPELDEAKKHTLMHGTLAHWATDALLQGAVRMGKIAIAPTITGGAEKVYDAEVVS